MTDPYLLLDWDTSPVYIYIHIYIHTYIHTYIQYTHARTHFRGLVPYRMAESVKSLVSGVKY